MNTPVGFEQCLTFINCHLQPPLRPALQPETGVKQAVTISRQSGCGAHRLAEKLAAYLQANSRGAAPWAIFDRNLVELVLADHQLPTRLARFMPEDRVFQIDDAVEEIFGLHPPSGTFVKQTEETISRLAEAGHAIILGRAANVITAEMPNTVHVRIVASLESRVRHMMEFEGLSAKAARERIQHEDAGRRRYVQKYYGKEVDDPLLYHLVINRDLVTLDEAARLIGDTVLTRARRR